MGETIVGEVSVVTGGEENDVFLKILKLLQKWVQMPQSILSTF